MSSALNRIHSVYVCECACMCYLNSTFWWHLRIKWNFFFRIARSVVIHVHSPHKHTHICTFVMGWRLDVIWNEYKVTAQYWHLLVVQTIGLATVSNSIPFFLSLSLSIFYFHFRRLAKVGRKFATFEWSVGCNWRNFHGRLYSAPKGTHGHMIFHKCFH